MKMIALLFFIVKFCCVFAEDMVDPIIIRGLEIDSIITPQLERLSAEDAIVTNASFNLNIEYQMKELGYSIGSKSINVYHRPNIYTINQSEWNKENKKHSEQIRIAVIVGRNNQNDALTGLYEQIGAGSSMMNNTSTYRVISNGPGEICIVMPANIRGSNDYVEIQRKLWFCRNNVAIEIASSGNINLWPIAEIVDRDIRSFLKE